MYKMSSGIVQINLSDAYLANVFHLLKEISANQYKENIIKAPKCNL
jgi:hypothetical protein